MQRAMTALLLALILSAGCSHDQGPQPAFYCQISLTLSPADSVRVGGTIALGAVNLLELPPGGCRSSQAFTWSSTNPQVATVQSNGAQGGPVLQALSPGVTTVWVRSAADTTVSDDHDIRVTP